VAVLEAVREPEFLEHASRLGETLRARLDELASRHPGIGDVRGLGPMLALELEERTPDRAKAVVDAGFEHGLLLLSCGLYGNVIRLLPPLTITDEELDEGLDLLDQALAAGLGG
jgi:4-aminobutyrate aminotransferase/(S)-3-amino-2-methylpropionate transaminase